MRYLGVLLLLFSTMANAQITNETILYPVIQNGKFGFITKEGQIAVTPDLPVPDYGLISEEESLKAFPRDFFTVKTKKGYVVFTKAPLKAWKEELYYRVEFDYQRNFVITIKKGDVSNLAAYGMGDAWGESIIYDFKGNELFKNPYKSYLQRNTTPYNSNRWVVQQNNKYGCIDEKGQTVIPLQYNLLRKFSDGYSIAQTEVGGKYGYLDANGKFVIKPIYSVATDMSYHRAFVKKNEIEVWTLIDNNGKEIAKKLSVSPVENARYSSINNKAYYNFDGDFCLVQDNDTKMQGFINSKGEIIIPCKYKSCSEFINLLSLVKTSDGKYTIINTTGAEQFAPLQLEGIGELQWNGMIAIKKNKLWGVMNTKGQIIIEPKFLSMPGNFIGGIARITEYSYDKEKGPANDNFYKVGYINTKGDWVWPLQQ